MKPKSPDKYGHSLGVDNYLKMVVPGYSSSQMKDYLGPYKDCSRVQAMFNDWVSYLFREKYVLMKVISELGKNGQRALYLDDERIDVISGNSLIIYYFKKGRFDMYGEERHRGFGVNEFLRLAV
jgi:hypothetical protein